MQLYLYLYLITIAFGMEAVKPSGEHKQYVICGGNSTKDFKMHFGTLSCPNYMDDSPYVTVRFSNEIYRTGWAYLTVNMTYGAFPPYIQGYLMGFAEAQATRSLMSDYIRNMVTDYCSRAEEYCEKLFDFLEKNYIWTKTMIDKNIDDDYWAEIAVGMGQVKGLIDGYENVKFMKIRTRDIVRHPVYLMQLFGDLEDLKVKFDRPENDPVNRGKGHCSALVKLLPSNTDLLFSHVTWTTYASMLRVQKQYSFATYNPGKVMTFSGYPGVVTSIDDFVLTSSKLAILETTIETHRKQLFNKIVSGTVLYFLRSQAAHRMADSGKKWVEIFSKFNSGTYNNQWVVVDYKKFRPNDYRLQQGLLTVLEQLPEMIISNDQTKVLEDTTYWAGYNRPFYKDIFNATGGNEMVKKFGNWYSHDKCPRALIFARDHKQVENMDGMFRLMRSNNYLKDPFSRCDCNPPYSAESAISARSDLNSPNGRYPIKDLGFLDQGATDVKITNNDLVGKLQFYAKAGPVWENDGNRGIPLFDWSTSVLNSTVPHYGQPQQWNFQQVLFDWHWK